jgi:putative hydrolase of HD superfamily
VDTTESVVIGLLDRINDLKRLPRTGWLLAGVHAPESVAEHSYATALLATMLGEMINEDWAGEGLERPLDLGRLARVALVHDLAESVLTDLPRRAAAVLGVAVKHEAEAHALASILDGLPQAVVYMELWSEYVQAASPEAQVVRDADKLELLHQALCYERYGHRGLDEFWQNHTFYFPASRAMFRSLCRTRAEL